MLRSFRVTNHRSFREEQELLLIPAYRSDAPVVPVAAVFGANASGKSNLLDALAWMRDAVLDSYRSWEPESGIPRNRFRLDPTSEAKSSDFVVDLLLDGVQFVYGFSASSLAIEEEWLHTYPHGRERVVFERHGQQVELGSTVPERRGRAELLESLLRDNALLLSTAAQAKQPEVLPVYRWFRDGLRMLGARRASAGTLHALADRVLATVPAHPEFVDLLRLADLGINSIEGRSRPMIRREPARGRRSPSRVPRRTVLIVIGADRTETAYLKGLRDHFRLATVTMKIVEKPGSPEQLVEHTRDTYPLDDFDEVWCVTDVDHFEREGGKVTDFAGGLDQAITRAKAIDPTGAEHTRNPSTGVWRLVSVLMEKE